MSPDPKPGVGQIPTSPVIFGLGGLRLGADEKAFFKASNPAGIMLFARNIEAPDQVRRLVADLKDTLGRDHLAVFIDQEGGRVQRLCPPNWRQAPAMARFGEVYAKTAKLASEALFLNIQLIGLDLRELGITVDCLPVLDLPVAGADEIIGDRAFSGDPEVVAALGKVAAQALKSVGVLPVVKHIPGHGRARVDSHKALPLVETPRAELSRSDFVPFAALNDCPFAMTAHVVFQDIDRGAPATFSKTVINEIIRGEIGFRNFLISDDINMRALYGSHRRRAEQCLAAGIDLVLHCSGTLSEMAGVMEGAGALDAEKTSRLASLLEKALEGEGPERGEVLEAYTLAEEKLGPGKN